MKLTNLDRFRAKKFPQFLAKIFMIWFKDHQNIYYSKRVSYSEVKLSKWQCDRKGDYIAVVPSPSSLSPTQEDVSIIQVPKRE